MLSFLFNKVGPVRPAEMCRKYILLGMFYYSPSPAPAYRIKRTSRVMPMRALLKTPVLLKMPASKNVKRAISARIATRVIVSTASVMTAKTEMASAGRVMMVGTLPKIALSRPLV